jgi:hypothetical protein
VKNPSGRRGIKSKANNSRKKNDEARKPRQKKMTD